MKKAVVKIMEITSFLFPDDIPLNIFNYGSPLVHALQDELGIKQVLEILTRFSLFQLYGEKKTLSVHRVVQEVIRVSLTDNEYVFNLIQNTIRMINKALETTSSPYDVLCSGNNTSKSLYTWSKLATTAIALKAHISKLLTNISECFSFHLSPEMANVLHTTAVYHSIHQRQDKA